MNPCRDYCEIDILFADLHRSRGSKWREPTVILGKYIAEGKVSGISTSFGVPACIDFISLHWYIYYSWSLYAMFDSWFLLWLTQYYCIILDVDLRIASCHQLIRLIVMILTHDDHSPASISLTYSRDFSDCDVIDTIFG